MGPRDTKYNPNSIPNLPNYNSSPIVTKLYTYSTHIQHKQIKPIKKMHDNRQARASTIPGV